jgi:hypothetical protein
MSWFPDAIIAYPPSSGNLGLVVRPIFSGSDPNVLTVKLASGSLSLSGSVTSSEARPTSSSLSTVGYSSASGSVLAEADSNRLGLYICNNSNKNLLIRLGPLPVGSASFSLILTPHSTYEASFPVYGGVVTGVWLPGGSGNAMVTQLFL